MNKEYKQMRLQGGEELICEVIDWPDFESEDSPESVIIRNAFLIISAEDWQSSTRYYTFRPFMLYQERTDQLISLNFYHITSIANPHDFIVAQYINHLENMRKIPKSSLDEVLEEMSDSDKDKIVSLRPRMH